MAKKTYQYHEPRWKDGQDPDCDTCWKRETCERAASGSFCGEWQSRKPKDRGESPSDRWTRGDEDPGL